MIIEAGPVTDEGAGLAIFSLSTYGQDTGVGRVGTCLLRGLDRGTGCGLCPITTSFPLSLAGIIRLSTDGPVVTRVTDRKKVETHSGTQSYVM